MTATRIEKDLIGTEHIPSDVYWGIQTLRAVTNFPITGIPISSHPNLIRALAAVKMACSHECSLRHLA